MTFTSWFRGVVPSEAEIRAEIWGLGVRHHGEPLSGALEELKAPGQAARRTALLRACVWKLQGR